MPTSVKRHRFARAEYLIHRSAEPFDCASWKLPHELPQRLEESQVTGVPLHPWSTEGWNDSESKKDGDVFQWTPCDPSYEDPLRPNATAITYGACAGFSITSWNGDQLVPASHPTFGLWVDAHVGSFERMSGMLTC